MTGSRVIQARLHPSNDDEAIALSVFDAWYEKHTARQILTNALLALGEYPIYEPDTVRAMRQMIEDLQAQLSETLSTLLEEKIDELAAMAPTERRRAVRDLTARSTYGASIRNAVDVADYEDQ